MELTTLSPLTVIPLFVGTTIFASDAKLAPVKVTGTRVPWAPPPGLIVVRAGPGELTVKVAVTIGLGTTLEALNVITHEWLPMVALAALTEAVRLAVVALLEGLKPSQSQSGPKDVVNPRPLDGLVLVTEILCADGTVPPTV